MKRHSGNGILETVLWSQGASETLRDESQGAGAWVGVGRELGCAGRHWARGGLGADSA